jgi:hypothetical protein
MPYPVGKDKIYEGDIKMIAFVLGGEGSQGAFDHPRQVVMGRQF